MSSTRIDAATLAPDQVVAAMAAVIDGGGVVAFPTDTVYGLGCDPRRLDAVARIYAIKDRPSGKPLSLLLATVDELCEYLARDARLAARAAQAFLPGALTLVVPRPEYVPPEITSGLDSVGLRVPSGELLAQLLDVVGPLASTSANLSGAPAHTGVAPIDLHGVDLFVDAGPTLHGVASTVIDFTVDPPRILREGAVSRERFAAWMEEQRDTGVVEELR